MGCVVHENAVIGDNCTVFQNVTIGSRWPGGRCEGLAPKIGHHVMVGAGAVILGNARIGDNCIIDANTVVITDIPSNSLTVGVPVQIKKKESGQKSTGEMRRSGESFRL